jgi:ribosomal protein S18 acetylase RimI-like enzyme
VTGSGSGIGPPLRAAAALGISYRPATDADLPFLAAVYASTRAEELAMTGWPDEMKLQFLEHQFNAQHTDYARNYPDAERLVIEHRGEDVGRLYLDEESTRFNLIDIALLPAARGRGRGGAILADILDQAAAAGKTVLIYVEKNNPARHLYDRLGFVCESDEGVYDLLKWGDRPSAED